MYKVLRVLRSESQAANSTDKTRDQVQWDACHFKFRRNQALCETTVILKRFHAPTAIESKRVGFKLSTKLPSSPVSPTDGVLVCQPRTGSIQRAESPAWPRNCKSLLPVTAHRSACKISPHKPVHRSYHVRFVISENIFC